MLDPFLCRARWAALSLALAAVLLGAATRAGAIEVTASVDRTQIAVGERAVLSIKVEGAQNVPAPTLAGVDGFQVHYQGPSTQVSWVNGRMSASVSHRYLLVARKTGTFNLGPFEVEHDGKKHRAPLIRMIVTAAQQGRANRGRARGGAANTPWLELVPGRREMFVGERIPLVIKLYIGGIRVDQLQFPKIASDGFVLDQLPQPSERREIVNGVQYRVLVFQTTITPIRAGELALGPATMGMVKLVSRRRRGLFDDFFSDAFAERQAIEARADAVSLSVHPLPESGKPATFAGAVGRFDFTIDAKPLDLNAGDPITVRLRISGQGNLTGVPPPRIPVDDRFRVYDALSVKGEAQPGTRVFEQVIIPREPEIRQLPAVSFSFFDPIARRYRTITRGPIPLRVRVATVSGAASAPQVLLSEQPADDDPVPETLGRDIVYIKDAPGRFRNRGIGWHRSRLYLALQLLPVAGFVGLLVFTRRRERFRADPRLLHFRQAGKVARRALAELEREAGGADFFDSLTGILNRYLSAKLDLPPGALDRERVFERLQDGGGGEELRKKVESFLGLAEHVRYAAGGDAGAGRADALRQARAIVDDMERDKRLARRFNGASMLTVFLLLAISGAPVLRAQAPHEDGERLDPNAAFYAGNASYRDGRYRSAIAEYEKVVAFGLESAALYFNLGNAHFKTGAIGAAALNYERARRLAPRDPDIGSNLGYARELAEDLGAPTPLWWRVLFPLAHRLTSGELTVASSLLWWGLWLLLAARTLLPRHRLVLTRAVTVNGLAFLLVASSLVVRLDAVDWSVAGVVTSEAPVAVRFEPSESGTEHFEVHEGAVLEVTGERGEWLQVRRPDGRRGWIPSRVLSLI